MSLYNTNVDDIYRPSFFELIASDRLIPSLQPAIRHSLLILSRHLPQPLPALVAGHTDELFYGLLLLIQRHYLRLYDSTFAENFYGLRRVQASLPHTFQYRTSSPHTAQLYGPQSVIHDKPSGAAQSEVRLSSLSPSTRNVTLLFTVLLPYLQSKLDSYYTELTSPLYNDPLLAPPPPLSRVQQLFVAVYPYLHALLESVRFFYQCRYLFELSAFFLPSHRWTSQLIRRLSADDMQKLTASNAPPAAASLAFEQAWAASAHLSLLGRLRALLANFSARLTSSAKYGLLFALLTVKFLDWYHSPSNPLSQSAAAFSSSSSSSSPFSTRTRPLASLPIPPPPPLPKQSEGGVHVDCASSVCGLCGRERTNAAADCSGWLFCYPCLFAHVSEYGVCPVTRQPCRLEQIRKIYDT